MGQKTEETEKGRRKSRRNIFFKMRREKGKHEKTSDCNERSKEWNQENACKERQC